MEKKFSFIVPAYNAAKYLGRCLDSLLDQDLPADEYEIVVVDDGSTDDTRGVLQRYARQAPNVRAFFTENRGVGEARNYACTQAEGKYFTFVDADDWVRPRSLRQLYGQMEAERLDLLVLNFRYWNDQGELPRLLHYTDRCRDGQPPLSGAQFMRRCLPPVVWGIVYRTAFWRTQGLRFLPIRHEDEELMPRALYLAERVNFCSMGFYNYYQNPSSFMMNYDPRSCLYMLEAMRSVDAFREQRVKGEEMDAFFRNLVSRNLLKALKRSIRCGAPLSAQLEAVTRMKTCGLSPLPRGKSFFYAFLYRLSPEWFVRFYRFRLKPSPACS